jgi:hypothetical protein
MRAGALKTESPVSCFKQLEQHINLLYGLKNLGGNCQSSMSRPAQTIILIKTTPVKIISKAVTRFGGEWGCLGGCQLPGMEKMCEPANFFEVQLFQLDSLRPPKTYGGLIYDSHHHKLMFARRWLCRGVPG